MSSTELSAAADALIEAYGVTEPPVPIDEIMMKPLPGLWTQTDFSQLTFSFATRGDRHAPRVSIARMIVRQLIDTDFGREHHLAKLIGTDPHRVTEMALLLLVPAVLLDRLPKSEHNAIAVAMTFMVPEEDAEARLGEIPPES